MRPEKRSFSIHGHRTSISLEAPFWDALKEVAEKEGLSLASLIASIDDGRRGGESGLSTAVRVWILDYYRTRRDVELTATRFDGGNRD